MAIKEAVIEKPKEMAIIWDNLPMNQLELPGDVWNNSPLFRNNIFAKVFNITSIPKTWGMPRIIRELYNQITEFEGSMNFYPEQFDFTFDFVEKMCNKEMCEVCFFGPNGSEEICIPTDDKYCPVVLITCGYFVKCLGENVYCIIREGLAKGICRGI